MLRRILPICAVLALSYSSPAVACSYEWGDASVTYMTPNGSPVVYKMFNCGGQYRKQYFDLDGKEWPQSRLVPSSRHQLNEALEELTGRDLDINAELDAEIVRIAKERGIL